VVVVVDSTALVQESLAGLVVLVVVVV